MSYETLQKAVNENPTMQVTLLGSDLLGMLDTMRNGLVAELRDTMTEVVLEARREMMSGVHALNQEKAMTREEVCRMLGVSMPTLNRWHKSGFLKASRIGGKVLYNPKDVRQIYEQRHGNAQ